MNRKNKVQSELKREISNILHNEIKDPRIGFITVTAVELSVDLKYSKVFYSVLGGHEDEEITQEILERASGFIRKLIGQKLKLRFVPELSFRLDKSIEKSLHIQKLLDNIKKSTDA